VEARLGGIDHEGGDAARALVGSVIANSTMYLATGPEVIQLFLPLMT
jgi:hypothetical protein